MKTQNDMKNELIDKLNERVDLLEEAILKAQNLFPPEEDGEPAWIEEAFEVLQDTVRV